MPARRDTRIEASRVRRLSPLQTFENQSQTWGICCHSCTWREGLAPSCRTALQGSSSPRGLPGSRGLLSTNGSHCALRINTTGLPLDCLRDKKFYERGLSWPPSGPLSPGDALDAGHADTPTPHQLTATRRSSPALSSSHPCWLRPR